MNFREYLLEAGFHGNRQIMFAHYYISPRHKELTPEEIHVREIAYSIKNVNSPDMEEAAKDMSKFVGPDDILVPIPSSKGDTSSNLELSKLIAKFSKSKVQDILGLKSNRMSNRELGLANKPRIKAQDMGLTIKSPTDTRKIVFIDNVSATGASIQAAMNLVNGGRGLVYAQVK